MHKLLVLSLHGLKIGAQGARRHLVRFVERNRQVVLPVVVLLGVCGKILCVSGREVVRIVHVHDVRDEELL